MQAIPLKLEQVKHKSNGKMATDIINIWRSYKKCLSAPNFSWKVLELRVNKKSLAYYVTWLPFQM